MRNYSTLRSFFRGLDGFLSRDGRVLISFGTTGDIDYLHFLIDTSELQREELRRVEGEKDGLPVAYVAYRLNRT
jgi:release factor glutamine methyltransferase